MDYGNNESNVKSNLELFRESLKEFIEKTPREELLKMLEIEEPKEATYSDFLVSKELALTLIDLKFELPCLFNLEETGSYSIRLTNTNLKIEDIQPSFNDKYDCVIPSYDQVMKWLRDKGYEVNITYLFMENIETKVGYEYEIIFKNKFLMRNQFYNTYEIARDEAIKEIIEHLKNTNDGNNI